jgi:hypothetical protein
MCKHVMSLVIILWKCVSNTKQEWKLTIEPLLKFVYLHLYKPFSWFCDTTSLEELAKVKLLSRALVGRKASSSFRCKVLHIEKFQ